MRIQRIFILWAEKKKTNFLEGLRPITIGVKLTQHIITRTSYYNSNIVEVVSRSGPAFLLQRLNNVDEQRYPLQAVVTSLFRLHQIRVVVCRNGGWGVIFSCFAWEHFHGFGLVVSPNLNSIGMLWHDLKTGLSCLETFQWGWIETILQRIVGHSSTVIWETWKIWKLELQNTGRGKIFFTASYIKPNLFTWAE